MPVGDVQPGSDRRTWQRYIALGDSFTEGLSDPEPGAPDTFRGWADRLAEHLAAAAPSGSIEYANLAIRGRLLAQVLAEQVEEGVRGVSCCRGSAAGSAASPPADGRAESGQPHYRVARNLVARDRFVT